jgi:glycosyltransferase involved in cell wall biosynthesis
VCVDPAPATDVNERSTMTKIAEYLALGKPVVAYDLHETANTAGDAALLVRRGDSDAFAGAISLLARDPELRARLAERARARASGLTWEHSERELLSAYAALR